MVRLHCIACDAPFEGIHFVHAARRVAEHFKEMHQESGISEREAHEAKLHAASRDRGVPLKHKLEAYINLDDPAASRFYVDGEDIGSTQLEMRLGKVSYNELVVRIPRNRVLCHVIQNGHTYEEAP